MTQQEFTLRYTYNTSSDCLGSGGYGTVYKAYDTYLDRWVAIKVSKVSTNEKLQNYRLLNEVSLVKSLPHHPNIAYYEDCFTYQSFDGEYDFGVLQYYSDGNLENLIENHALSEQEKHDFLMKILQGLHFLHTHGVIHRDLKPANILIANRNGEFIPKITDFGISKKYNISHTSVSNTIVGGSMGFSCPEQYNPNTLIRPNADLWSFGVMAYWLFTNKIPVENIVILLDTTEYRQLLNKIDAENNIPSAYKQLIKQCLVYNPENRIKTAENCINMIENIDELSKEKTTSQFYKNDLTTIIRSKTLPKTKQVIDLDQEKIEIYNINELSRCKVIKPNFCEICGNPLNQKSKLLFDPDYNSTEVAICTYCNVENEYIYLDRTFSKNCNCCGIPSLEIVKKKYCKNCGLPHYLSFNLYKLISFYEPFTLDIFFERYNDIRNNNQFYRNNPEFPLIVPNYVYETIIEKIRVKASNEGIIKIPTTRYYELGCGDYYLYEYNILSNYKIVAGTPFYNDWAIIKNTFKTQDFLLNKTMDYDGHKINSLLPFGMDYPIFLSDTQFGFILIGVKDTSIRGFHVNHVQLLETKKNIDIRHEFKGYSFVYGNDRIYFSVDENSLEKEIIKVVNLDKECLVYHHNDFVKSDFRSMEVLHEMNEFKNIKEITFIGNKNDEEFEKVLHTILVEIHIENGQLYFNEIKININRIIDKSTNLISSNILQDFESLNEYEKISFHELEKFVSVNKHSMLLVFIDCNNIYYRICKQSFEENNVVVFAINPLLDFNETSFISKWILSLNYKRNRKLLIESAIALSCKNITRDKDYYFQFKYYLNSQEVYFLVGDNLIEMGGYYQKKEIVDYIFSEKNISEWLGLAFKGLENQYRVLTGDISNRLLLEYFGYTLLFNNEIFINYDCTIPSLKSKYIFFKTNDLKKTLQLKIRNRIELDFTKDLDISTSINITYEEAIEKSNEFIVCNSEGQFLTIEPISPSKISEDKQYYQFDNLGNSYIPKNWLRLLDYDGNILEPLNSVFATKIEVDIDSNITITVKINRKEVLKLN